ncbi:hypothetical protein [Larkinella soli]|uniref:hypothetical protein n=1 Tax=Larkinella soli TaxID=1770527 RepID=UPI000FFBAB57|nr:hypothetical protein [Larkinella soli]
MKTIVRTASALLLGSLLMISAPSFAQATLETKPFAVATYPSADPLKLWMAIQKNDAESKLFVQLVDQENRVLYSEYLPKKMKIYRQRFDMAGLEDGIYTLRISNGSEMVEKSFRMKTPGIQERLPQRLLTVVPGDKAPAGM